MISQNALFFSSQNKRKEKIQHDFVFTAISTPDTLEL